MENFIYSIPTKVFFGRNMLEKLPECILEFGSRVLLVYGGGSIKRTGLYGKIIKLFQENEIYYRELSGVEPNPRLSTVKKGVELCRKDMVDVILPVGGGSTIDCAKGIAAAISISDTVTTWLFIGLIVGTMPSLFREAGKEGRGAASWVSLLVCAFVVFAGLFYVSHVADVSVEPNFWWYNFCGVLWGMSIVIPGMTSSSVMMALGLYQPMLEGIGELNPAVLLPLGTGAFLCVLFMGKAVALGYQKRYEILSPGVLGAISATTVMLIFSAERMCIEWLSIGFLLTCPKKIKRKPAKADFQKFIRKDVTYPKDR